MPTTHVDAGIADAVIGNVAVARYKLVMGRRIGSATYPLPAVAAASASLVRVILTKRSARQCLAIRASLA